MPKIEGGFILDDSELAPYGINKDDDNISESKNTKSKDNDATKDWLLALAENVGAFYFFIAFLCYVFYNVPYRGICLWMIKKLWIPSEKFS